MALNQGYSLTENVIDTSNKLNDLLVNKGASLLVDIENDVSCKTKIDELGRIINTLKQYSTKSHSLEYIGFLGHFSSGKSSTTNSLLKTWDTPGQRATDLHPTDDSVTLTTHKENSHKLLGTHRKGELKVGSQFVDVESLKNRVLVDTPGSGDPIIVEEMVRDFLPICDHIIYMFSATTPLDSNDVPILRKSYNELPFIPIKFIVTRANEFIKDRSKGFSKFNVDENKINKFKSELIARLEHLLPGKRFSDEDFLLIDNLDKYNTELLSDYIFNVDGSFKDIHSHKIKYFIDNIKEIRNYFNNYTYDKIDSLNELVTIASSNHDKYKEAYLMGESDLTESWRDIISETKNKRNNVTNKLNNFKEKISIPENIESIKNIETYNKDLSSETTRNIDIYTNTVTDSIERMSDKIISKIKKESKEIINLSSIEDIDISSISDITDNDFNFKGPAIPPLLLRNIRLINSQINSELNLIELEINHCTSYLTNVTNVTKQNSNIAFEEKSTLKSQKDLEKILDKFYSHVVIYKGAILAIDAIGISEKLRLGDAIDELNKVDFNDEYKRKIKEGMIGSIYLDRCFHIKEYNSYLLSVFNKNEMIIKPNSQSNETHFEENIKLEEKINSDLYSEINNHINNAKLKKEIKNEIIEKIRLAIVNSQKTCRDEIINENDKFRKIVLMRFFGASLIGFALALFFIISINNFGLEIPLLEQIIQNGFLANMLTSLFFISISNGFAWLSNSYKKPHMDNMKTIPEKNKSKLISEIEKIKINKADIINSQEINTKNFLSDLWNCTAEKELLNSISRNKKYFNELKSYSTSTLEVIELYKNSSVNFLEKIIKFYDNPKNNLKKLSDISHKIKDDAIEPSFNLFKKRQVELNEFYEDIKKIEII